MGIRRAERADLAAVRTIVARAYAPWAEVLGVRPRPMTADYPALIRDERVYVLDNDEVDGLIVLVPEDDTLLVANVAVLPDRQGRGLGRRLMAFAEHRARTLELPALRLYTHEKMSPNITLYEFLGYRETGRETAEVGNVVHLRKDL